MPFGGLGMTREQKAQAIAVLSARFSEAGRDPATLDVCDALGSVDGSLERSLDQVPALIDAGVTVFRVHLRRFSSTPEDVLPTLERIARLWEPYRTAASRVHD